MAEPRMVRGPDGDLYQIPADATDAQISAYLKAIPEANAPNAPKAKTWTDLAVSAIPALAGAAGGLIGGMGGTVLGFGVGGVPGAAGGAAVGTAGGEAAKQLINRARGADAPATMGAAASGIAVPALEAGASTAALGGAGKLLRPVAGTVLQKVGGAMESPSTVRQMVGKAVSATGKLIDAADAPALPKMQLNTADVAKIRDLMKAGMPQGEAVKRVWNFKVQQIISGAP